MQNSVINGRPRSIYYRIREWVKYIVEENSWGLRTKVRYNIFIVILLDLQSKFTERGPKIFTCTR